jgi:hypothetical protein
MAKVWFGHDSGGYEQVSVPYASENVAVHQLLAVADGADPEKVWSDGEYVTHHDKPIPWLNVPDNVEVVSKAEHNRIHKPRERLNEEICEQIRKEKQSMTFQELSEKYGACKSAIAKHVYGDCSHKETPAIDKKKGPRDGDWRDKDVFKKLYVEQDMTLTEVADELGCSQATASNWKIKHGL